MTKDSELINIATTPSAADVEIIDEDGGAIFNGTTPTSVTLKKADGYFDKKSYKMTISLDGYTAQTINMQTSPSGWYIVGNLVFGGLIGWLIVDPLTGAMWTISPTDINEELVQTTAMDDGGTGLQILLLAEASNEFKAVMKPLN